ncbi:copper resistance CopC/CopD family protein [Paenibacillus xanthanilyticus]|uniref:Copper resistance CopC/CopD family protein n=1 Tax=Paenibacillus xanthanilyticus TaxID=1783531 RepID=A0ABV8JZV9_9BACL
MSKSLRRKTTALLAAIFLSAALWLLLPGGVGSAHSSLMDAAPAPDGRLAVAPSAIVLQFNERLEDKGFAIQVYDREGLPVAKREAAMDADRRSMRLPLPPLSDGSYTVAYRLLSADGHPVRASYVFTVGQTTEPIRGYVSASRLHEEHVLGDNIPYWVVRGLYFAGLLAAAGWVGLRVYAAAVAERIGRRYGLTRQLLIGFHLLALLLLAWQDYGKLSIGFDDSERLDLLFGTSIGLSYVIAIPVAAAGFWLTGRRRAADGLWIMLLFGAKGLNGHAMGYAAPSLTYALDMLHLVAACLWAGVLLAFAVAGPRRLTDGEGADAARLSHTAFVAIVILAVSGLATAALYTNGFDRLLDSQWGRLMLAKTGAVVLIVVAGAFVRRSLRSGKLRRGSAWLIFDGGLFAAVIGITAVFTYLNPLAATGPLFWHEKVDGAHIAAIITPNKAGTTNQFLVAIGGLKQVSSTGNKEASAEGDDGPRKVTLRLQPIDRPEIAPIDVPLAKVPTEGGPGSLYDYNYATEGSYLALPGKWRLEVRVQDKKLNEIVTVTSFYSDNETER